MSSYGQISLIPSSRATYVASTGFFTTATSATDVFTLYGSSSKTIEILSIRLIQERDATNTALLKALVIKRGSTASGGTSSTVSAISLDSNNSATTATNIKSYTANPTVGSTVGTVSNGAIHYTNPSGSFSVYSSPIVQLFDANKYGQAIVLRGVNEGIAVNFNGVTDPINTSVLIEVVWTER